MITWGFVVIQNDCGEWMRKPGTSWDGWKNIAGHSVVDKMSKMTYDKGEHAAKRGGWHMQKTPHSKKAKSTMQWREELKKLPALICTWRAGGKAAREG